VTYAFARSRLPQTSQSDLSPDASQFLNIADCFNSGWEDENLCFQNFIEAFAQEKSVKEILAAMEDARTQNSTVENSCHPISHAIGRFAFEKYGNVGDAFESCDFSCHSGCYHGVMERMFYGESTDYNQHLSFADISGFMPTVCSPDKFNNPTTNIIFQCLHGVGHAVLYTIDYDLEEALQLCDLLPTDYDRNSCYGGVIMENVTAFEKDKRDLDERDPHYPCNKLDQRYGYQCYLMQTSVMSEYGYTYAQIADLCEDAGLFKAQCHTSLGRDLSNLARIGDADTVVDACMVKEDSVFSHNCFAGAVYALVDNTWSEEYAFPLCAKIPEAGIRSDCFRLARNYYTSVYHKGADEIDAECDLYAGDKAMECRGAVGGTY
jgi:hypothetical protein